MNPMKRSTAMSRDPKDRAEIGEPLIGDGGSGGEGKGASTVDDVSVDKDADVDVDRKTNGEIRRTPEPEDVP